MSGKSRGSHGAFQGDRKPVAFALSAATLYGIGLPLSKLLLKGIHPIAMAGLLYVGALAGLCIYYVLRKAAGKGARYSPLRGNDYKWLAGSIMTGGFLGPILLMAGLSLITGFAASLLSNLEAIFTAILAAVVFRESSGARLWAAVCCMTAGSALLSYDPAQGGASLLGPLLVTLSMVCWGLDNNFTRNISTKDPVRIAIWKSLVAGFGPLLMIFLLGSAPAPDIIAVKVMAVGAFGYGASLVLFIMALKGLGSSRTAALFGFAPFIGALASLVILREWLGWVMLPAAMLMATGLVLLVYEKHAHPHHHPATSHRHHHRHDDWHHHHAHGPQGRRAAGPQGYKGSPPKTGGPVFSAQKDQPVFRALTSSCSSAAGTTEGRPRRAQGNAAAQDVATGIEHVHVHKHHGLRHTHDHWPDGEHRHTHDDGDE